MKTQFSPKGSDKSSIRATRKRRMKTKLIGSASSCNELRTLLESRWSWVNVTFDLVTHEVRVGDKVIDGIRVIKKGNRVRLEKIEIGGES